MGIFAYVLFFLIGLFLLWKAGDHCVKYSVEFSLLFHFESFAIGFFLFAVSTGLPEISSAIVSSLEKVPELSAGDLIGSSFFNLTGILGLVILLSKKIEIIKALRKRMLVTTSIILVISISLLFFSQGNLFLGISLILLYFVSMGFFKTPYQKKLFSEELEEGKKEIKQLEKKAFFSAKIDVCLKLFMSITILLLSSWLTIHSAIQVATYWQLDLALLGGTFVAIGTGLPELSLEIHAIRKKQYSLALGDIFGSTFLNVSFILGLLISLNPSLSLNFARISFPFMGLLLIYLLWKIFYARYWKKREGYILSFSFLVFLVYIAIIEAFYLHYL